MQIYAHGYFISLIAKSLSWKVYLKLFNQI